MIPTKIVKRLPLLFALALASAVLPGLSAAQTPSPRDGSIARGDTAWAERAQADDPAKPVTERAEEAIAAYAEAFENDPNDLEAAWKLLRAIHFKGDYIAEGNDARREVFAQGREVAEAALDQLGEKVGGRDALEKMDAEEAAEALSDVPEAVKIYFWGAVNWGLWGDAYGKFAAARQGVAKRLRDYAERAIALDADYETGGGHRVLGRLHSEAPKIPFITGWVSRDKAIEELRRAVEVGPENVFNHLYLAEALLDHGDGDQREEGLEILRAVISSEPREEFTVEDSSIIEDARGRLAEEET